MVGGGVQDLCPVTSLLPVYDSSYFLIFLRKGGEGERGWGSVPVDSLLDKRMGAID